MISSFDKALVMYAFGSADIFPNEKEFCAN